MLLWSRVHAQVCVPDADPVSPSPDAGGAGIGIGLSTYDDDIAAEATSGARTELLKVPIKFVPIRAPDILTCLRPFVNSRIIVNPSSALPRDVCVPLTLDKKVPVSPSDTVPEMFPPSIRRQRL